MTGAAEPLCPRPSWRRRLACFTVACTTTALVTAPRSSPSSALRRPPVGCAATAFSLPVAGSDRGPKGYVLVDPLEKRAVQTENLWPELTMDQEDGVGVNMTDLVLMPSGRGGRRYLAPRRKNQEQSDLKEGAANPALGLPPLKDRTFLITGATSGIGLATAERLVKQGCTVLVHGRKEQKVIHVMKMLQQKNIHANIDGYVADLSVMREVRDLADMVTGDHGKIHGVLLNAATIDGDFTGKRTITREQNEHTLAVNVLAPFLLTSLLLGALKASGAGRVIFSCSKAMGGAHRLRDLHGEKQWTGYTAYNMTKLCDAMLAKELDQRYGDAPRLTFHGLEPGLADTRLMRHGAAWGRGKRKARATHHVHTYGTFPNAKKATASFDALVEDAFQEVSGNCDITEADDPKALAALDSAKKRERLWDEVCELTGADWPDTLETGQWRHVDKPTFSSVYDMLAQ